VAENPPPVEPAARSWTALAPALRSRNFRLFWVGQSVSTMGTFLQVVAGSWLLYELTGSTLWLGVLGVVGLLPVVPISFLGGVLVDRVPRRRLIMITQIGLLAQAVVFGLLVVTGRISVWHIIVLDFVMGALFAIDMPARQAFLVELVDEDDLANAIETQALTVRPLRAKGRHGGEDNIFLNSFKRFVINAHLHQRGRGQIGEHYISGGDEFFYHLPAFRFGRVQRHAALVAVHLHKQSALTIIRHRCSVTILTARQFLDANNISAKLRQ